MSGAQETPRQKMIGMMYLVLTAMLALNVSAQILLSFLVVNDAVEQSFKNSKTKEEALFNKFDQQYQANQQKTQANYDKAQIVKKKTQDLIDFIQNQRYEVVAACEKISIEQAKVLEPKDIKRQDNYDDPMRYFLGVSEDETKGQAFVLKNKILQYKKDLLDLLPDDSKDKVELGLKVEGPFKDADGRDQSWEKHFFSHTIIVANITMLNSIEIDVLNAEYNVVAQLLAAVSDDDFKFDNIKARVVPVSNYVNQGGTFKADLFVAAFDSKAQISAEIAGQKYVGDSGNIKFTRPATTLGLQKVVGTIFIQSPLGVKPYPFDFQYTVTKPMATVSADKMNVFYIGVDNPVSIMAGGATDANTLATISQGNLSKQSDGTYIARVTNQGQVEVDVYVLDGKTKTLMAKKMFRAKKVPDPVPRVNGQQPGVNKIEKNALAGAGGLLVAMKDFDFELNVQVSSFTMFVARGGQLSANMTSNGNRFSDDMVSYLNRCKRGDKVYIDDITVKMPDGVRNLGSMIITVL